ncbi:hypothetical protein OAA62_00035 [bacterium]|nr:hypothetical protein [bacterium]
MSKKNIDFSSKIKNNFNIDFSISKSFVDNFINYLNHKVDFFNANCSPNKVSLSQLKEVYKRGISDAIKLDKPSGLWAAARVNMFLKMTSGSKVLDSYKKLDRDIANDCSFFIDDGVRDDIIFSYENITEAKFELESFNLNDCEDYSFVDLEEYYEPNFPNHKSVND